MLLYLGLKGVTHILTLSPMSVFCQARVALDEQ